MPNSFRESRSNYPIVLSLFGPLKQGISVNEGVVTGVVNVGVLESLQGERLIAYFKKSFRRMYM